MKKFLKAIPLPAAAVALGLAALGNLIQSYSEGVRLVFGALAAVLWVLLILKVIFCWSGVRQNMADAAVASVTGSTFSMCTMLLAAYAAPWIGGAARVLWMTGLALNVAFILWFTVRFAAKRDLSKVFASYFVAYVGIVVSSLTAPAFGMAASVGTWAFWFGLACLICLLPIVTYRYIKLPVKADPPKPLFCIYTAPASLCLAGYIQSVENKSAALIFALLALSTVLYLIVLVRLPSLSKLPFSPSYAAFTFPFVITAIAAKQSMACLTGLGYSVSWLSPVVLIETVIAAVLVIYTLIRYLMAVGKAVSAPAAAS